MVLNQVFPIFNLGLVNPAYFKVVLHNTPRKKKFWCQGFKDLKLKNDLTLEVIEIVFTLKVDFGRSLLRTTSLTNAPTKIRH